MSDVGLQTVNQLGASRQAAVIATQVVPMVNSNVPIVRSYREAMGRYLDEPPTPQSLAGYLAARYTHEVLLGLDAAPTRSSVLAALQKRGSLDLGGFRIDLEGKRRSGTFVTQSMISTDGRLVGKPDHASELVWRGCYAPARYPYLTQRQCKPEIASPPWTWAPTASAWKLGVSTTVNFDAPNTSKRPCARAAVWTKTATSPPAMQAGWECLARFGERLAGFKPSEVKAVATQTLREARNRDAFLERANEVLGFPIDVISGREEARLIYQGVAHMLPASDERRLVIDIGGRSTELILGPGLTPKVMESFRVGSIAWSTRYFADGVFSKRSFEMAEIAATAVLDEALDAYHPDRWNTAYGSAGTVGAISDVLVAAGWPAGSITQDGLDWLLERLIAAQSADKLRMPGMREDRKAIIGGGVSVMRAVFNLLGITQLHQAAGGLRHGLICDLLGSIPPTRRLARQQCAAPGPQVQCGRRARRTCGQGGHRTVDPSAGQTPAWAHPTRHACCASWAGRPTCTKSAATSRHSDYHKHGAYILDNADAMGFSLSEMHRLSLLVLGHRGKLRKLEAELTDHGLAAATDGAAPGRDLVPRPP